MSTTCGAPCGRADRLGAVGGRPDDAEVALRAKQRGEAGAHDLLVVDDGDPDRHGRALDRKHGVDGEAAAVGRPGASVPPTMVARSRMPSSPCPSGSVQSAGPGRGRGPEAAARRACSSSFDLDGCAWCVPAGVGERLLHDPVRRQVDARRQRHDGALER